VRLIHLILVTVLTVPVAVSAQGADAAAELAAKVQARYSGIRDFEGDFVQTYEGGVLRTRTSESGTMAIKRPGRMKWVYLKPERKEFVSDGVRIYSYLVADKQVIVSPVPGPGEATTPALFLTGQADLARDFTASLTDLPRAPEGLLELKLVPKKEDAEYEWIGIGVDPASFQIRYLVAMDRQGGQSAFAFSNLKENQGLTDKTFEFRIPRGVDVITNGARTPRR
jgi:outer membrane lipoprotein carrier protein